MASTQTTMKIIIASEHYLIRESIRMLLNSSGVRKTIIEADNELKLLDLVTKYSAHIVICDSDLPSRDLVKMLAKIENIHASLDILIFTETIKEQQVQQQFKNIPIVCIDELDVGDHLLEIVNQLYRQQITVTDTDDQLTSTNCAGD